MKTAEEILEKFIFYDNTIELVNKEDAIGAMEEYAEQRIREELIAYNKYYNEQVFGKDSELAKNPETLTVKEYLKQREK